MVGRPPHSRKKFGQIGGTVGTARANPQKSAKNAVPQAATWWERFLWWERKRVTDLFATLAPKERHKPRIGEGNATFLHDLASNVSDSAMRAKFKAGEYPDLHTPSIAGWRRLAGRTAK